MTWVLQVTLICIQCSISFLLFLTFLMLFLKLSFSSPEISQKLLKAPPPLFLLFFFLNESSCFIWPGSNILLIFNLPGSKRIFHLIQRDSFAFSYFELFHPCSAKLIDDLLRCKSVLAIRDSMQPNNLSRVLMGQYVELLCYLVWHPIALQQIFTTRTWRSVVHNSHQQFCMNLQYCLWT